MASTVSIGRGWRSSPAGSLRSRRRYAAAVRRASTGSIRLVDQAATVRQIQAFAEGVGQAYDHVLVLGIGGSALGTKALLNALRRPAWNEWDDEGREFFPRLTILENVDPTSVAAALERIDPRRVLVNVISKSGGTAETMAQYLVVREWLEQALGSAASRHLVFTTDPDRGALRELAAARAYRHAGCSARGGRPVQRAFPGWPACRRRWSESMWRPCWRAPAWRWSAPNRMTCCRIRPRSTRALHWAADTGLAARVHVLMPYTDRLREFAEWYRQLWAESLGKRVDRNGKPVHVGPTPVGAVGATDQHSQVQLFMEGPLRQGHHLRDRGRPRCGCPDSRSAEACGGLGQISRRTSNTSRATRWASCFGPSTRRPPRPWPQMGRMSCTLSLPDLTPATLGEAIMFFQLATGYAGAWYGIDPFDQPGVELGKRLTYAAMGRPGYQAEPRKAAAEHRRGVDRRSALRPYSSRPTFGRPYGHCVQEDRRAWLMQHSG